MMMVIVMLMMEYETNKCHTFVTRIRVLKGFDGDNDDDDV